MIALSKKQIENIPALSKEMTAVAIAKKYGVHPQAIYYWFREFRKRGIKIYTKVGRPKTL